MLRRHVHLHAATGYLPEKIEKCPDIGRIYGPVAGRQMVKVSWKPKAEPMDNIDFARDYPELIADYQAKREALGHIRLGKDAGHRKDTAKTNLQRQGHWRDLHALASQQV